MKITTLNVFVFVILLVAHYYLVNRSEKGFFAQTSLPKSVINRPSSECIDVAPTTKGCMGMPSGHVETTTIFAFVLYQYEYLSGLVMVAIIVAMCIQRVLFERHTIGQVIAGSLFGFLYGSIYYKTRLSFISLVIPVVSIIIFSTLSQIMKNKSTPINESL